ncbi:hypothetical protein R3P38DRAFT_3084685 [Favolaschia claudopus]|uniref:Uncharacterized protein n=1 Tax=Favolaschia claudopus TaxID=2862362 RepID=A0AAV9ZVX0_9AGAR
MPFQHTAEDSEYIDSLPNKVIKEFRSSIYTSAYIETHSHEFITTNWIDVGQIRQFVDNGCSLRVSASSPPVFTTTRVKLEGNASDPSATRSFDAPPPLRVKTHTEGNREVLEILSDSEDEGVRVKQEPADTGDVVDISSDSEEEAVQNNQGICSFYHTNSSSLTYTTGEHTRSSSPLPPSSDFPSDSFEDDLEPSKTFSKLNPELTSSIWTGHHRVTQEVTVKRIEYLNGLPSIFPIPKIPTAFVITLDDPDFDIVDPKTGQFYTPDALIKNKDNDSWRGNTGKGDSKVWVSYGPGEKPILCRRARLECTGAYVCERVDPRLLEVERRDLDTASRDRVFAAQRQTRREEGTTGEQKAVEFVQLIRNKKCFGVDKNGEKCDGIPVLRTQKQAFNGHKHFVGCSGWNKDFTHHRSYALPPDLPERLFIKAFHGQPLVDDDSKDTSACSAILHPTTGFKQRTGCAHTHIINGVGVSSAIVNRECDAKRTIFVPVDPSIRKALVVHPHNIAHNHPMPALKKASIQTKNTYVKLVKDHGVVGATVRKVDCAASTKVSLKGKTPAEHDPALHSAQLKRRLIAATKKEAYPDGLDIAGACKLFLNDISKGIDDKYVQRLVTLPDGGVMILTCLAKLLELADDPGVTCFETDTTFTRVDGDFNEWEVVIFLKALQRAVTIARGYVNGASAEFFERLFDELQGMKLDLTGKPFGFKRLVPGGNLIALNSDMDGAQVLGAARSFLKTSDPEFSGISRDTPGEEFAPEIIKLCVTHAKRGALDLQSHVSAEDHRRIMDFVNINSVDSLKEFDDFIRSLKVKKVQDWWDHKLMSEWILRCLVKSLSPMSDEDWDNTASTTNTGEAQHHWTKLQTGTKLSLVEAIESAREVDQRVAREIEISENSGILLNSHNESYHRRARNTTRHSTTMRKAAEAREREDEQVEIEMEIEEVEANKRDSAARLKELRAARKATRKGAGKRGGKGTKSTVVSSNSSGRVKTRTRTSASSATVVHDDENMETNQAPPAASSSTAGDPPAVHQISNPSPLAQFNAGGTGWGNFDFTFNTGEVPYTTGSAYNSGAYQAMNPTFSNVDAYSSPAGFVYNTENMDFSFGFWNDPILPQSYANSSQTPMHQYSTTGDALLDAVLFPDGMINYSGNAVQSYTSTPALSHHFPPPSPAVQSAASSSTAEAAPKKPVSRKRKADEVDLANVITTARSRKAPRRADAGL